jgi:iron complex transport system substrate-binding protein
MLGSGSKARIVWLACLAVLIGAAAWTAGCTASEESESEEGAAAASESGGGTGDVAAFPVTVTDDAGRRVTVAARPERIVSLAPANTEILAELGLVGSLVGVTELDDYPAEVADIAKVGDFVTPNLEAIAAAEPDLVLATTGVQADVVERLEELGAVVVAVDPQSLEDLFASITMVGDVTGESDAASDLVSGMREDIAALTDAVSAEETVTVFVEIAQDPLFTAGPGTLIDDLLVAAGGANVVSEPGYVAYSAEQVVSDDPGVYLATAGSMSDPASISSRPGFASLTAVEEDRVAILDDNLVSRPGPRVVLGIEQIAEALHPEVF